MFLGQREGGEEKGKTTTNECIDQRSSETQMATEVSVGQLCVHRWPTYDELVLG